MRKRFGIKVLLPSLILIGSAEAILTAEKPDEISLRAEAGNIVKRFGSTLKPKLLEAIQAGGIEHAIDVCSVEAPQIARALSEETGWSVRRVSLKARNASSATPDTFEADVLAKFDQRESTGELVADIEHSEIDGDQYRFMKAQPVEGICLNCHGYDIAPSVMDAIEKHYPDDLATGYSVGQVRGAFSLVKEL